MDYLIEIMGMNPKNIIIMGRSIGTGPAAVMASLYNPAALILISAFTTFREVVANQIGESLAYLVKDRFDTRSLVRDKVSCPIFFIHGQ